MRFCTAQSLPLEGKVARSAERGGGRRFLRCCAFLSRNVAAAQNVLRFSSSVGCADSFPSRGSLFSAQNVLRSSSSVRFADSYPYPLCPFGTFPPDRGNRPLKGKPFGECAKKPPLSGKAARRNAGTERLQQIDDDLSVSLWLTASPPLLSLRDISP